MKAFFLFLAWSALAMGYPPTPNRDETPGSLCTENSSDFEGYRYPEKIAHCERNVSAATKTEIYELYRIPERERREYTIDHLIPLSIGGDNEKENLWPEHKAVKAKRPRLEEQVYSALKEGRVTQRQAIDKVLKEKFAAAEEYLSAQ